MAWVHYAIIIKWHGRFGWLGDLRNGNTFHPPASRPLAINAIRVDSFWYPTLIQLCAIRSNPPIFVQCHWIGSFASTTRPNSEYRKSLCFKLHFGRSNQHGNTRRHDVEKVPIAKFTADNKGRRLHFICFLPGQDEFAFAFPT